MLGIWQIELGSNIQLSDMKSLVKKKKKREEIPLSGMLKRATRQERVNVCRLELPDFFPCGHWQALCMTYVSFDFGFCLDWQNNFLRHRSCTPHALVL